jgi:predicted DNA-binding transcriptional regulator AlpA
MTADRLLKPRDVAVTLGLSMATVLDYFERGILPGFRMGGRKGGPVRFWESEILATIESWRVGTVPGNVNGPATLSRSGPVLKEVSP